MCVLNSSFKYNKNMEEQKRPKVGVGVFVFKDGKVLMGPRVNTHGADTYCGPGGHLEFGETIEECAARETREEAGIEIENVRIISFSNLLLWGKHYLDIGVVADWKSGEPQALEPDVRPEWGWYDLDKLPGERFPSDVFKLEALKTGKMYFGTVRE